MTATPPIPPLRRPQFKPTLILHGGAGNIRRSHLPPELYERYRDSLLTYLRSTADLLNGREDTGGEGYPYSALDAAVHAVSLMEDDELFNCGRGSVFTTNGTIEMEASVMVTSVAPDDPEKEGNADVVEGMIKRGAGVMMVKNVRHPIKLAREVLLRTGQDGSDSSSGGSMHSQLAGPHVEQLASDWGLEFKPDDWFWTKRRWEEHRRGLSSGGGPTIDHDGAREAEQKQNGQYLSQGTVGCVCLDQWGSLAVATSTGGMTNKFPGRIGDTPTLGAGFWAESWTENGRDNHDAKQPGKENAGLLSSIWGKGSSHKSGPTHTALSSRNHRRRRRAVAMSGTGNGDSFLRVAATRTAASMCRFLPASQQFSLGDAVSAVAGPGGELQRSAGTRWGSSSEGTGGIIGIEAEHDDESILDEQGNNHSDGEDSDLRRGQVVFDFNGGGMFRAWIEEDNNGVERERMMVFRDEYE